MTAIIFIMVVVFFFVLFSVVVRFTAPEEPACDFFDAPRELSDEAYRKIFGNDKEALKREKEAWIRTCKKVSEEHKHMLKEMRANE